MVDLSAADENRTQIAPGPLGTLAQRRARARTAAKAPWARRTEIHRARPPFGLAMVISDRMRRPNGCLPISPLDQRSNQAQEFLLFGSAASGDEKSSDLNVGDLST